MPAKVLPTETKRWLLYNRNRKTQECASKTLVSPGTCGATLRRLAAAVEPWPCQASALDITIGGTEPEQLPTR